MSKCICTLICAILLLSPLSAYAAETESNTTSMSAIERKLKIYILEIQGLLMLDAAGKTELVEKGANKVHQNVEEYLESLEEGVNVYDLESYDTLITSLEQLDLKIEPFSTQSVTQASSTKSWRYGDILYYGAGSDSAAREKSFTGHTAVLSTTKYYVIEASKTSNNGAKVHHWNRSKLWKGATGIKQLKVTTKTGKNATASQRKTAVKFGLNQVGESYSLKTTLGNTSKWYCSKLTYAMWKDADYDLRSARKYMYNGFQIVIPADILADANTRVVKKWGKTLPGLI